MGKSGGGNSGKVEYPAYMETQHTLWVDDIDDIIFDVILEYINKTISNTSYIYIALYKHIHIAHNGEIYIQKNIDSDKNKKYKYKYKIKKIIDKIITSELISDVFNDMIYSDKNIFNNNNEGVYLIIVEIVKKIQTDNSL